MTVRKRAELMIFGVALAAFLATACGTTPPVPPPQPTSTPAVTAAPTPTPVATSAPTPTPAATPAPTAVPTTTPQATVRPTPSPTPTAPPATATPAIVKADPEAGEKTFYAVGCIGCHTVQGVGGRVGPELTDIAKRRDAAYIRQSEKDPKAFVVPGYPPVMPSAAELGLSDQDVENIVAWFQSLR